MDWLRQLNDTPVSTILVIAGIVFIALAVGVGLKFLHIPPLKSRWQQLLAGIVGVVLLIGGILIPLLPTPPPPSDPRTTVIALMNQEVSAAENQDIALVNRIYAKDAIVKDAACQPGDQYKTWSGRNEIDARYSSLPRFLSLDHVNKQVTSLIPDDSSATQATATSSTQGQFVDGSQKRISLAGNERWEFSKIGGQWYITSFTFSMC